MPPAPRSSPSSAVRLRDIRWSSTASFFWADAQFRAGAPISAAEDCSPPATGKYRSELRSPCGSTGRFDSAVNRWFSWCKAKLCGGHPGASASCAGSTLSTSGTACDSLFRNSYGRVCIATTKSSNVRPGLSSNVSLSRSSARMRSRRKLRKSSRDSHQAPNVQAVPQK